MLPIYELEILEDMVFETLQLKRIIQNPLSASRLTELRALLQNEKEAVPQRVRKAMSKFLRESHKNTYIQLQQSGITRMLDMLFQYLLPKDVKSIYKVSTINTVDAIYKLLYVELEQLLLHLQANYKTYFDFDGKLPEGFKQGYEAMMVDTATKIEGALSNKVDKAFLDLLCEPFLQFARWEMDYSFRELQYLEDLRVCILSTMIDADDNVAETLTGQLMQLNFNSVLFFNYKILRLNEEASNRKTVNERVEYFSWQIKLINQTVLRKDVIYLKHLPPIQDQLVFWIAEDLYYLDKKHQLSLALPVNREVEKDKLKKVHVQLTVADLALGAKLLLDTEVIVNINYTELMKLVAKGFRTNRQARISEQAIYNVGFVNSTSSKEKMKHVLMKMVRKIGEY